MTTKNPKQKSQSQKFIDKARELGCDEDEQTFANKLKQIAKSPPPEKKSTKKPTPSK